MSDTFWQGHAKGFYFRIGGYGLAFELDMPVLFSERYGYRKVLRIGRLALQLLKPERPRPNRPWRGKCIACEFPNSYPGQIGQHSPNCRRAHSATGGL